MKILFYGGRQAGVVGLLTVLARKHEVICVVPVDEPVESVARSLSLTVEKPKNINEESFVEKIKEWKPDLFLCCHGRQMIRSIILSLVPCMNVHPCLYAYKGAEPVKKLLEDKNTKASVAVHWMSEKVDDGEVIIERFKEVESKTVEGIYNELYPAYSITIAEALEKIQHKRVLDPKFH